MDIPQHEEFPVQGEVTLNTITSPNEITVRRTNRDTAAATSYPEGGNKFHQKIRPGQLTLAWRNQDWSPTMGMSAAERPAVFGSLNGVSFAGARNPADLMDKMWPVGFSKSTIDPSAPNDPDNASGLAVVVAGGAVPVPYVGKKTTYPGDLVIVNGVDFHNVVDESIVPNTQPSKGIILPVVESARKEELKHSSYLYYNELMEDRYGVDPLYAVNIGRLHPEESKEFTARQTAALGRKATTLTTVVRGVHSLADRGIVKIMTPQETKLQELVDQFVAGTLAEGEFKTQYTAAQAEYTDVTMETPTNDTFRRSGENGFAGTLDARHTHPHAYFSRGLNIPADKRDAAMAKRKRDVLWFARTMGVAGDNEELPITTDVLRTVHYSMEILSNDTAADYGPFAHESATNTTTAALQNLHATQRYGALGGFGVDARRRSNLELDYEHNARNHDTYAESAFAEARHMLNRRCVGMALDAGIPGINSKMNILARCSGGIY